MRSRKARSTLFAATLGACIAASAGHSAQATTTDVYFLIDGSGSVGATGFADEKSFVGSVVGDLRSADTVGALEFASSISHNQSLTNLAGSGRTTVTSAVSGFPYTGGTGADKLAFQTALDALDTAATAGDRKFIVLVTDNGEPDPLASQSPCSLASSLTAAGIQTFVVEGNTTANGVGIYESCLMANPATQTLTVGTFSQLPTLVSPVVNIIDPPSVPEPASLAILALGLAGVGAVGRARRLRAG